MVNASILVIGSGIAGLNFALKASEHSDVLIITKESLETSNSFLAQGGVAAVFSSEDNFENHINDTMKVGENLNDRKVVEFVVKNSPKEILALEKYGAKFDKSRGEFIMSRESAHSHARVVHASDTTGMHIERVLAENVRKNPRIKIIEDCIAFDLIIDGKTCYGVYALDWKNSEIISIKSKAVVFATGGAGQLFRFTTNPSIATADGIALGYNAGAKVRGLEFVQFHPTMFSEESFLISETVRGHGAILRNTLGERFMENFPMKELEARNIVAREIFRQMQKTSSDSVLLDISHENPDFVKKRFPNIYSVCLRNGFDITKQQIPVQPSAHYMCGGVVVNIDAETNISGLYAIGECSCTGLHGADRMASNSLAEALVFSTRCADSVKDYVSGREICDIGKSPAKINIKISPEILILGEDLRNLMWDYAGIVRNKIGLETALKEISKLRIHAEKIFLDGISREIVELRNMLVVSELIVKSALIREESRGCHFREDFAE